MTGATPPMTTWLSPESKPAWLPAKDDPCTGHLVEGPIPAWEQGPAIQSLADEEPCLEGLLKAGQQPDWGWW